MSKNVYQWRPRTKFDIDPQLAGQELEKIKGHNSGEVTPEAVIKAAEAATSPLHSLFEWDDAKAAQQQRLTTAGLLIRSIVVTIVSEGPQEPTEMTVAVTEDAPQSQGSAAVHVLSEAELHASKVERGRTELQKWIATYAGLPEFAQIGGVLAALLPAKDKAA